MIKHEYKIDYLEKKILEAQLETERLDLELFRALAGQYALEAELLNILLRKTFGGSYTYLKNRIEIRTDDGWIPVLFREIFLRKPSAHSSSPTAHFSKVLSSGRVSKGYPLIVNANDIRSGENIRKMSNTPTAAAIEATEDG